MIKIYEHKRGEKIMNTHFILSLALLNVHFQILGVINLPHEHHASGFLERRLNSEFLSDEIVSSLSEAKSSETLPIIAQVYKIKEAIIALENDRNASLDKAFHYEEDLGVLKQQLQKLCMKIRFLAEPFSSKIRQQKENIRDRLIQEMSQRG